MHAGPGTGKTRVVTRRIAAQVAAGVPPGGILAVTFTDRAAREMAQRLRRMRVPAGGGGVRAATFHSAALRQVSYFWPRRAGTRLDILPSKARILGDLIRRHPLTRTMTVADVAAEIEWVKSHGPAGGERVGGPIQPGIARLDLDVEVPRWYLDAEAYAARLEHRDGPWPAETEPEQAAEVLAALMDRLEESKARAAQIDFDDVLAVAAGLLRDDDEVADRVRGQFTHLTVDEFQDVNRLQWDLLCAWVGDRDDVCVVGDPDQAIYGFTGATPAYLDAFVRRWSHAQVIRLRRNYRSSQTILDLAGRLLERDDGRLEAVAPEGPAPELVEHPDEETERDTVVRRCRELRGAGVSWEEMAILYRFNAQSEAWERSLADAEIPFRLHDDPGFFGRRHVQQALTVMEGAARDGEGEPAADDPLVLLEGAPPVHPTLDRLVPRILQRRMSWTPEEPSGERARERWADLRVLVDLAEERAEGDPDATLDDYLADLRERAALGRTPVDGGVHLLTLHRAKGLEFDAVFVVGADEGRVPSRYAVAHDARLQRAGVSAPSAVAEERRLFYVGVTRARRHLQVSWSTDGRRRRSRFLGGRTIRSARSGSSGGAVRREERAPLEPEDLELFEALREWRLERSFSDGVPAYVVLHDAALREIARRRPTDRDALGRVHGIGPTKLARYGDDVLELVSERR